MTNRTKTSAFRGFGHRLFLASLKAYPEVFRAEFGGDMEATFIARAEDRIRGPGGMTFFLLRECAGAGLGGLRTRFEGLGRRWGRSRSGPKPVRFKEPSRLGGFRELPRNLGQDFRQALRALFRRPGATINGVLALGLGIGLTTLVFCIVYGAAFRPLPVPDGRRIVHMEYRHPERGRERLGVSLHDLADWRSGQESFEDLGGFYTATVNVSGLDRPERYSGAFVTANTFDLLRVVPVMGRGFLPGEDRPGAPAVVILSQGVWESRFGGEPDVVGRVIRVNGESATVVGIMPEGMGFPYWEDVWLPIRDDPLSLARGEGPGLEVFGRLRDGVTLQEAIPEFRGISTRLAEAYPETNEGRQALLEPYTVSYLGPEARPGILVMLLTGFAVLLIASFNVANLLLAQAVARMKDLAVRVALGAGRRRVIMKVLHEALLLAAMGAALGICLAVAGVELIDRQVLATATFPPPFWMIFEVDAPILVFVVGATLLAAATSGLIPALKASRTDVHALLQDTSRGGSSLRMGRLSRMLVGAELTVSAMLLVVSGHMALGIHRLGNVEYGFATHDVLTARVGLFEGYFPTRESRLGFYEQLQTRLEQQPGVISAGLASTLPGKNTSRYPFSEMEGEYTEEQNLPSVRWARVSPGFFRGLDAPVLRGREFTVDDGPDAMPVAVVNASFVDRYLQGREPLGVRIRPGGVEDDSPWLTIVGVVPDLNMDGGMEPRGNPEGVYRPLAQGDLNFVSIAVRTEGDPMAFAPVLRNQVMALQGDTPIYYVETLRDSINTNLLDIVLMGGLFIGFGLAAFLMASVGLYAVTSFLASQRTRELGLRMALGAGAGEVVSLVLRRGLVQVIIGLSVGSLLGVGGTQLLAGEGLQVSSWNLPVTASVFLVLGATGLWAVLAPALRATRLDPVEALREE